MVKIYPYIAGQTFNTHKAFLKKLTKKVKTVSEPKKSKVIILFCPIVSRFQTDINSAMEEFRSKMADSEGKTLILVAMHHTFDKNYTLPNCRAQQEGVSLMVDCLFHERDGFLDCPQNKNAYKKVRKELGLKKIGCVH